VCQLAQSRYVKQSGQNSRKYVNGYHIIHYVTFIRHQHNYLKLIRYISRLCRGIIKTWLGTNPNPRMLQDFFNRDAVTLIQL